MSEERGEKEMIPLRAPEEVPEGMSEGEARAFWQAHEISEEYLEKAGPPPEGVLPPAKPGEPPRGAREAAGEVEGGGRG